MTTRARQGHQGFTLVELMVTILVMGILLSIAVPTFRSATLSTQLRAVANNLVAATLAARSEAIKRNIAVTLCVSANGTDCGTGGWEQGWIVACRSNDNVNCFAGGTNWMVLHREHPAPTSVRVTEAGGITQIAFSPTGVGAGATTFKVCRTNPVGNEERRVSISPTGRASVTKTTTAICP